MSTSVTAPARRSSIRRTLLAFSLLLVLLPALVFAVVVGLFGYQSVLGNARDQLSSVADLKQQEIEQWVVNEREGDLAVLATETALQQFLQAMIDSPAGSRERLAAYSEVGIRLSSFLRKKVAFEEFFLLDPQTGQTLVSTDVRREGQSHYDEAYFIRGREGLFLQPPTIDPIADVPVLLLSRPVEDPNGEVLAVLVGRANLSDLGELIRAGAGLGPTAESYLVSAEGLYVVGGRGPATPEEAVDSPGIRAALGGGEAVEQYVNYRGEEVVGAYRWLPGLEVALLVEESLSEVRAAAFRQLPAVLGALVPVVVLALGLALLLTRRIVGPVVELTDAATKIASGELERVVPVRRADEIGALAEVFNSMTAQLRDLIGSLERRVAERTQGLQAAAEVAYATTSVLDPDELLRQVVDVARERFDLYYVGLFLLDEERRFAMLRAGTGEAGRQMMARGHRLEVGGESMVGWCTATGRARIALDVGEEAVRFENPLLPETRSEMALPLRSRGRVIGAMTVQSREEAAFDEADIAVMQTMADQVAVAIDNARLFVQTQEALEEMEATHRRYLGRAWAEYAASRAVTGYEQAGAEVRALTEETLPGVAQAVAARRAIVLEGDGDDDGTAAGSALIVPVTLRGQPIGALGFKAAGEDRRWSADDIALAQAISEQFSLAADNLRLLGETQSRVARERLLGEVTARMRASLDMGLVLKTAVQEIGRALGLRALDARLGVEPDWTDE